MKTPLMMIINPAAGKGGFKRSLPDALRLLSDTGYAVSLFFTECRGHATELATQYAGAFPYLLVLGGDGTLAEAIAGLMPLAERPKVGYIPIGTANDVARTIGLPKNDILAGAQHFIGGTPHEFDEGRRDGGYFNYVAAFGAEDGNNRTAPGSSNAPCGKTAVPGFPAGVWVFSCRVVPCPHRGWRTPAPA